MVPATQFSIATLQLQSIEALFNEGDCAICLDEISVGAQFTRMPCLIHKFHTDCIVKWLNKNHYRPICRFKMPTKVTMEVMKKIIQNN